MKKYLLLITICIGLAIFFYPTISNTKENGSPGEKTNSPMDGQSCTSCHSGTINSGTGTATITTNIPSSGYSIGSTYTITLTGIKASCTRFGFELTAEDGINKAGTFFITNSTETKFANGTSNTAVTHKTAGNSGTNTKSWSMDWTASATANNSTTFYASLLFANNNGNNNGDNVFTTSHVAVEATPTWDCISPGNCQDPGNGQGTYASLSSCQSSCITPSWNCDGQGNCSDPGTGNGTYATLTACQTACIVIPQTWDCDTWAGNCSDPGTGQGTYASLAACNNNCTATPTWDCISPGNCQDPGNGQGTYASLSSCQSSCITPSWNCDLATGICYDPGNGQGFYNSLSVCQSACSSSSSIWCEDFESLAVGDPIAETSSSWNTWGELMNGATAPFTDDARISNTQFSSGANSLYFPPTAAAGPEDVVLMFDPTLNITQTTLPTLSTPYVVGNFIFSQMMYVSSGAGAFFNFQAENTPGVSWALEVNLTDNGTPTGDILMSNTSGTYFTAAYPTDTWFEIKFNIDLSNNNWEVLVDGVSFGSFANTINQVASLDLYPRMNDEFYVDDVCYHYTPATLPVNNGQVSSISTITGLVGQTRYPSVEIRNLGIDPIYSCDVTFDYNGIQMTENLTNIGAGFGLLSLNSMQVDFANSITLITGTNTGTATISNVNGALTDDDPSDDIMTTQITAITPAAGKLVIGEEATGTWCGWCPRGAVALNWMDHDYEGYWQGIAVHNGDLMADPGYDNGLYVFHGGSYPSGVVDRTNNINPADFKQDFLQRIVIPPSGIITNGAELNGNVLKVSLTVDFQIAVSGNYKLACIIVEDSVTGSGPDYYQANSYSGGGAGPLVDVDGTDWANMPSNVPASSMIYRHVGRSIKPSFSGWDLSSTSYSAGDSETICYEFALDPSWDQSQISIVGMLLDGSNITDNGSSTSLTDAIATGLSGPCMPSWDCINNTCIDPGTGNGMYTSLSACNNNCLITSVYVQGIESLMIYPNPVNDVLYIDGDYDAVQIFDILGNSLLQSDKESEINVSHLSVGAYIIELKIANKSVRKKLQISR